MCIRDRYTSFCAHDLSKNFSYTYIQNIFKYILLLTNFNLLIIPSLNQKYFENYQDLFKIFSKNQLLACCVDRAVDRLCFRSDRSTDRSTRNLTVWVCACVHISRSTGRSIGPHFSRSTFGRLKVINSLFVSVDRAVDREPETAKFYENPVDRGWISALTAS